MPTIQYSSIRKKLDGLMSKYKAVKNKVHKDNCRASGLDFLKQIFNISKCKCLPKIDTNSGATIFQCECPYKEILNSRQYEFLSDQICERIINIDFWFGVDADADAISQDMVNLSMSPVCQQLTPASEPSPPPPFNRVENIMENVDDTDGSNDDNYIDDPNYSPDAKANIPKSINLPDSIATLDFDALCAESARFNCSAKEVAAIVNRSFEMLGAITDNAKGLVVTPSLIQKKKNKLISVQKLKKRLLTKTSTGKYAVFFLMAWQPKIW